MSGHWEPQQLTKIQEEDICMCLGFEGVKAPGVLCWGSLGETSLSFSVSALWINCVIEQDIWVSTVGNLELNWWGNLVWPHVCGVWWEVGTCLAGSALSEGAVVPAVTASGSGNVTTRESHEWSDCIIYLKTYNAQWH